jgi:hypothetical protein
MLPEIDIPRLASVSCASARSACAASGWADVGVGGICCNSASAIIPSRFCSEVSLKV